MVVGSVLIAAGVAKLRMGAHPFARAILGYRLLPPALVPPVARVLPALEILIGAALVTAVYLHLAALLAAALLATFTCAISVALARGQRNACGCGTPGAPALALVSRRLVIRNLVLMTLLVISATSTEGWTW